MQPVTHITSRDFLAVVTGAFEVLLKYLEMFVFNLCLCRHGPRHDQRRFLNVNVATRR